MNLVHNAPVELPPARSFPLPTPVLYPVDPPPRPSHFPLGFSNPLIPPPPVPMLYIINFPPRAGPPYPMLAPPHPITKPCHPLLHRPLPPPPPKTPITDRRTYWIRLFSKCSPKGASQAFQTTMLFPMAGSAAERHVTDRQIDKTKWTNILDSDDYLVMTFFILQNKIFQNSSFSTLS